MAQHTVKHLGDLDLHGNLTLVSQVTDFPANPRIGTMVMKDNCMYVYALIGSLETWYPYASATASYIHTQGLAAQTWTITHNLDSLNLWFQVKDSDGNILAVNKTDVNRNVFTLNFTSPVVGTVVVVAPEKIDVPQVRATGLIVGNNNEVVVDSSGVLINGSYALTTAVISSEIATAVSGEATLRANADTTLTSNLASEVTRAQSAEATLTTSIATEASSRVAGDAALQGQIDSILSNVDATALNSLSEIVTAFQAADGTLDGAITTLAGSVTTGLNGKEDVIAAGTTSQYYRGDKTWQTFPDIPTTAYVITTPVITGNSSAALGQVYTLSFSATPGLANSSIISFTVTLPDGTVQTITAASNAGSTTWTATGTVGNSVSFSVVANDNLGNKSQSASKTVTLVQVSVNVPSITSPAANATGMSNTFTASTGSFALTPATGYSDTHQYTDWEIWTGAGRTGTLVWSSLNDATNKTSITVPSSANLQVSTTYYLMARHKGTTYGWSGYSSCTFTTASQFVPTAAGTSYQGGYYAGRIMIGSSKYAIVVAPKASGHSIKQWKTTNDTTSGTLSLNDGLSNSNAMNNASHPAAQFCRSLSIGGYSDWYLPSRDELEVCYRNLKPTTTSNVVYASRATNWGVSVGTYNGVDAQGNGDNDFSVDAMGAYNGTAYTTTSPAQTTATAFITGNAESFDNAWYWSSTEFNSTTAWLQTFAVGYQGTINKSDNNYVRAVRKVLI